MWLIVDNSTSQCYILFTETCQRIRLCFNNVLSGIVYADKLSQMYQQFDGKFWCDNIRQRQTHSWCFLKGSMCRCVHGRHKRFRTYSSGKTLQNNFLSERNVIKYHLRLDGYINGIQCHVRGFSWWNLSYHMQTMQNRKRDVCRLHE